MAGVGPEVRLPSAWGEVAARDAEAEGSDGDSSEPEATVRMPTSASVACTASQAQGQRRRAHNPFVEYEDREQRLQWERRWLQEDVNYLRERSQELRHNVVQRRLDLGNASQGHMFENTVIYNEYSHQVRCSTALRRELRRFREETGPLKELALPRIQRLRAARQRQADPAEPRSGKLKDRTATARSVKQLQALQQALQESHESLQPAKSIALSRPRTARGQQSLSPVGRDKEGCAA